MPRTKHFLGVVIVCILLLILSKALLYQAEKSQESDIKNIVRDLLSSILGVSNERQIKLESISADFVGKPSNLQTPAEQENANIESNEYVKSYPVDPHVWDSFMDNKWCNVACPAGVPCEYHDEVDMRIIVMTFDRPDSLRQCLKSVGELDTVGDLISVDIWLDRSVQGTVDNETLQVARDFKKSWTNGRVCIHKQTAHVNIGGQWRNTWRPKENSKEMCLILEDDIDISPFAYRWLKNVNKKYGHRTDISGYTLKMEDLQFFGSSHVHMMKGPTTDSVFLYGVLGTWGFSPTPHAWRDFQDWYFSKNDSLKPYVEGIEPTRWYHKHERKHTEETMSEMWFIYHNNITDRYCLFSNLVEYTGDKYVLLAVNRMERGLHYRGGMVFDNTPYMLRKWNESYVKFPDKIVKYNYHGVPIE